MKLKKLILQGFKSFKDKTSVHFDDGITGIVGPNGCGKSNIVDALFWVMGEQSAKHLRGKSMKDLIFAGSAKYGPGAFAEVVLVLENTTEKHIHIGKKVMAPKEIQITRKLYRNGDTEYRINGILARLRDIQEVFMDTGAGAKSYSIIAQGEIDRLVQAKPEERRVMIEEVAGITKFKFRKRESERKIEQTNLNLNRLKDLQSEIHKNLKSLEKQAERAERARNLKKKIEKADVLVNAHKEFDRLKGLSEINNFIQERSLKIEEWKECRNSLESDLVREREEKVSLSEQIEVLGREVNEKSKRLAAAEEKLNYMGRAREEKLSFMEMKVKENAGILEDIDKGKTRLEDLNNQIQHCTDSRDEREETGLQSQVDREKEFLAEGEEKLGKLQGELERERSEHLGLEQRLFQVKSRIGELTQGLEDTAIEIEETEKHYSGMSDEMTQERMEVNASQDKIKKMETALLKLKKLVRTREREKADLGREIDVLTKEMVKKESMQESLKAINKNYQDQGRGVREFLQNFSDNCALFAETIHCENEYTRAVQAALATRVNSIVLKEGAKEISFFQWLEEEELSADFLACREQSFQAIPGMRPLLDVVEIVDDKDDGRIRSLLNGIYIAEQLDEECIPSLGQYSFAVVVSADGGRVVESLGNALRVRCLSGSGEGTQTIIARNNLIQQLEGEISSLGLELDEKKLALSEVEERGTAENEERDEQQKKLFQEQVTFAALRAALDTKLGSLDSGNARIQLLKEKKHSFSGERVALLEEEERIKEIKARLEKCLGDRSTAIETLKRDVDKRSFEYVELRQQSLVKKVEDQAFDDKVVSLRQQVADVEGRVSNHLSRLQENNIIISRYEEELGEVEETIKELRVSNESDTSELDKSEQDFNQVKKQFSRLLVQMEERERDVAKFFQKINSSEKEIVAKEGKREQIIADEEQIARNIFEKYQIDLRTELAQFLDLEVSDLEGLGDISEVYYMDVLNEETDEVERRRITPKPYKFERKYGQELRDKKDRLRQYKQSYARIGEINWQAIGDYEHQKARYQFLKEQENELKASVLDLENAISQIDEKSRARFKTAFEEVGVRFEKVFPIIFGGGSARLRLVGNFDDPECGIDIIAQPPGKKMQNVNLMSGGEKALTAVSLIFSTFLVKPSPFCLLDEVDAPLDDANVGRFNELLAEMSDQSQFILITHNKKTMEFNDTLYGVTMQEPGISTAVSVQLH